MHEAVSVWHRGNVRKKRQSSLHLFFFLNWEQVKKEYILKVVGGSGTRGEKDPEVWVGKSSCPVEDLWLIFSVSGDGDA